MLMGNAPDHAQRTFDPFLLSGFALPSFSPGCVNRTEIKGCLQANRGSKCMFYGPTGGIRVGSRHTNDEALTDHMR